MNRREFLQTTGAAAAAGLVEVRRSWGADEAKKVWVVVDPADAVASTPPGKWAIAHLQDALAARGVPVATCARVEQAPAGSRCVLIHPSKTINPDTAESVAFSRSEAQGRPLLLVSPDGPLGLVYALTEIADRVRHAKDALAALDVQDVVAENPANRIRGILRPFASDVEDKPWFNSEDFWRRYLDVLATERFNRFHLALGLGYDFTREIKDAYFHFAYPFLVAPHGYDEVRATNLRDAERDQNLRMLKFASDAAAERGLHFQLGLWTHAYAWENSPEANHRIEGLTRENHAAYCRDALRMVLKGCPNIAGVTFRIHGESGVAEGSYGFWKTVFDGAATCGRKVELDLHAKGIDDDIINTALATGLAVTVSPKSWAEHMGLPYHQAWIRPNELPRQEKGEGLFAQSGGARRFLRYGYGDLLREDRRYGVLHRTWPGTQRLLLWGDAETAKAYALFGQFCGSDGIELFDPLSFKGKKGSGVRGGRGEDFERYLYQYRVWGRLLYNPESGPDAARRILWKSCGEGAAHMEKALAAASRILPLITTAHCPSAANNNYWPEMYQNMSLVEEVPPRPYNDTPKPRRFGTVSPLDPQLFSTVDEHALELLSGTRSGKYSPIDVAAWLDALCETAATNLAEAERRSRRVNEMATDAAIQIGLGQFFANKFRAAVLYSVWLQTGDHGVLNDCVQQYGAAGKAWAELAERAKRPYAADITFGPEPQQRGHWLDRLDAIQRDVTLVHEQHGSVPTTRPFAGTRTLHTRAWLNPPPRPAGRASVAESKSFQRGQPLTVELSVTGKMPDQVHLIYRHVNQAEPWRREPMTGEGESFRFTIPAAYTDSPYPLQYYCELRSAVDGVWLCPGFNARRTNQPYVVARMSRAK